MKPKLYKFKDVQPWDSYEESVPGSVEWAARVSKSLQVHSEDRSKSAGIYLPKTIKAILEGNPPPWEIYPPDNPFGTPDIYCKALTGHSWEGVLALVADLDPKDERLMRAALAEAQAIKVGQSPLQMLRSAWAKATPEEQALFLGEIKH